MKKNKERAVKQRESLPEVEEGECSSGESPEIIEIKDSPSEVEILEEESFVLDLTKDVEEGDAPIVISTQESKDTSHGKRTSSGRYHAPTEGGSSGGDFKAGRLSDNLQQALGIGPNDIPDYIYRMRKMGFVNGYPPAYLKQALVKSSRQDSMLRFHTEEGRIVEEEEENPEAPSLNQNKIIYYFGFNKTYRNLRDRERFIVPPFDEFVRLLETEMRKRWKEERSDSKRKAKKHGESTPTKVNKKSSAFDSQRKRKATSNNDSTPSKVDKQDLAEESDGTPSTGTPATEKSPVTPKQSSLVETTVSLGTPISSRKATDSQDKPTLEAFSVGIVPFRVDPPTEKTGFFKKMMNKIKDVMS